MKEKVAISFLGICPRETPIHEHKEKYTKISTTTLFHTVKYLKNMCSCLPGGSDDKDSACNVGDPSLIPGLGRSPGVWNGYPL